MRKSKDKWVDGVIGGIAENYGLDPFFCRMAFIVLLATPLPVLLAYIICSFCMKEGL